MNAGLTPHRVSLLITLLLVPSLSAQSAASRPVPVDVPVSELDRGARILGRIGVPLGEIVTVQGVVIDGPFKGYEGGPNVCVQRVNGRATQRYTRVPLHACFGRFGEGALPKLVMGEAYEFEGYETGGY